MNNNDYQNEILKLQKQVERLKKSVKKQKYGLVWMDVPEAFEDDVENKLPILKEVPELAIKNDDGKPTHILIEGDNYHALTCLNYTHKGKIDLIYIDPPYNTGNDGFRYKDKRILSSYPDGTEVPRNHPFRHSYWLSFMSKRIELSRNLLSKRGVIFISIDDNEFAQLKLLCDSIFNEENFVIDVIWNSRKSVSNDTIVSLNHNHTLVYAKDISVLQEIKQEFRLKMDKNKFSNPDNDSRGPWTADPFDAPNIRPNLTYEIKNPNTGKKFMPPKGRCWRTTEKDYLKYLNDGRIIFGKSGKSKPQLKRFLYEVEAKGSTAKSIWDDVGTTTNGTKELEKILGDKIFNNPKPTSLLKRIIELSTVKKSYVLDFFAGSGTTGHSVVLKNIDDNGQRKFILVTNNEANIMKDVCYPRIYKVLNGKVPDMQDTNGSLKYYRTSFIGKRNITNIKDEDKVLIAHNAGELLALSENTLDLINKDDWMQLYENIDRYTAIYFREEMTNFEKFKSTVKKLDKPVSIYVFSWGDNEFPDDFAEIKDAKVKTIPAPILEIYKQIYNLNTK